MISSEDIEAWREDEKQTEFLARERRRADNHIGWKVQMYDKGWKEVGVTFHNKEMCIKSLAVWKNFWPKYEFRVYELVKEKL